MTKGSGRSIMQYKAVAEGHAAEELFLEARCSSRSLWLRCKRQMVVYTTFAVGVPINFVFYRGFPCV